MWVMKCTCAKPTAHRLSAWATVSRHSFQPDGNWALTIYPSGLKPTSAPQLLLLPTGVGQRVTLTHDLISHGSATLLPDGERVLFEGSKPGRAQRTWVQDVTGGEPLPITPEGIAGHWVSPDGKMLVVVDSQQRFWLYPMDRGQPEALPGIGRGEDMIRWSGDGKYLYVANEGIIPVRVYRVEVSTGRRQHIFTLSPSDAAGLGSIYSVLLRPTPSLTLIPIIGFSPTSISRLD